jgi:hypothetical protein
MFKEIKISMPKELRKKQDDNEIVNFCCSFEKVWHFLKLLNTELSYDLAILC